MIPEKGEPKPLGAHFSPSWTNFCLMSAKAGSVRLELFNSAGDTRPSESFPMHKSGDFWHLRLPGIRPGQLYAYRVGGIWQPEAGARFNAAKILLDPYARDLAGTFDWAHQGMYFHDLSSDRLDLSCNGTDNTAVIPKCVVVDEGEFDWQDDKPPATPWSQTVIYETHLRGFTQHPSSGVKQRGTYLGFSEKIQHIKKLGVSAVEFLPLQEFEPFQHSRNLKPEKNIRNYWGYNTISFNTPRRAYATSPGRARHELKVLVRDLHREGLEVILDIVFNHTCESDELGPSLSFRGIDNETYYMLKDKRLYQNHTGCGNTVNVNHPHVRQFILDCLKHWVEDYHVDGFRFDLAAIFFRDKNGQPSASSPILQEMSAWAAEHNIKLIAEPWDAAGLYSLGSFPEKWGEWNGQYRDVVRSFWKGDADVTRHFTTRIMGSADIFHSRKGALSSVNFVTAHDGFTLRDLVSYESKHNADNGEDNRDGESHNNSCNWGTEGETSDPAILAQRAKMLKNFLLTLFLSRGVPMMLGGDECGRTQRGNNNAYCQDNEISWFDWDLAAKYEWLQDFTRQCLDFRRSNPDFYHHEDMGNIELNISWFDENLNTPFWEDPSLRHIAQWKFCRTARADGSFKSYFVVFNAEDRALNQKLPPTGDRGPWRIFIDTSKDAKAARADANIDISGLVSVAPKSTMLLIQQN